MTAPEAHVRSLEVRPAAGQHLGAHPLVEHAVRRRLRPKVHIPPALRVEPQLRSGLMLPDSKVCAHANDRVVPTVLPSPWPLTGCHLEHACNPFDLKEHVVVHRFTDSAPSHSWRQRLRLLLDERPTHAKRTRWQLVGESSSDCIHTRARGSACLLYPEHVEVAVVAGVLEVAQLAVTQHANVLF